MSRKKIIIGLVVAGICFFIDGIYLKAKAILGQYLLETSWQQTLDGEIHVKPWPWADTWPIAKLVHSRLNEHYIVLEGATGRTLAFAPGLLSGSARPGKSGHSIISAHRTSHFRFLQFAKIGDIFVLTDQAGIDYRYKVDDIQIVDINDTDLIANNDISRLTLITCYPFEDLSASSSKRFIVSAILENST